MDILILIALLVANLILEIKFLVGVRALKNEFFMGYGAMFILLTICLLHSSYWMLYIILSAYEGKDNVNTIGFLYIVEYIVSVIVGWIFIFALDIKKCIRAKGVN